MAEEVKTGNDGFSAKKIDIKDIKKGDIEDVARNIGLSPIIEKESNKPEARFYKGACKVCGGDITENIVREYNAMSGPLIIGPGSRNQFYYKSNGLYCKCCGIKYEFVPEKDDEDES